MIQTAIVAGGLGTRMRSVSEQVPKVMLPVLGKPLLEHQIDWLKKSGLTEVFLCLGFKAEAVQKHFGDGAKWGMTLHYQVEQTPRGTAGAVKDLSPQLSGDLLLIYGDLYAEVDYGKLLKFHAAHAGAATLVVFETDHPYDSDMVRAEGNLITGFHRPKPGEVFENIAAAAIWVLRPRLLDLIPREVPSDFGRDIFPKALAAGEKLYCYRTTERVEDVGTPERLEKFRSERA